MAIKKFRANVALPDLSGGVHPAGEVFEADESDPRTFGGRATVVDDAGTPVPAAVLAAEASAKRPRRKARATEPGPEADQLGTDGPADDQ